MIELDQSLVQDLQRIAREHGDVVLQTLVHIDPDDQGRYLLEGQSVAIAARLVGHYHHAPPGPDRRKIAQFLVLFSGRA
jgi:hypothetical protein